MSQKTNELIVLEPLEINAETNWSGDSLIGISDKARNTANEIVEKIKQAEQHVVSAKEAGEAVHRDHKIPLLPIYWRSASKNRHLSATMKNLEAVSSLFEVQQTYIELINQSTRFGREVNTALVAYIEQSYRSQMGSVSKLSNESEMAISSLVQHANTVLDIQERSSKQILFSIGISAASLMVAIVSIVLVFTT
jgi:predicted lipoprotein